MVKWLQRQEVIDLRTVYLRWCAELSPHNETDEEDKDVTDSDKDDNEDAAEVNDQVTTKTPDVWAILPIPCRKSTCIPQHPTSSSRAGIWCL